MNGLRWTEEDFAAHRARFPALTREPPPMPAVKPRKAPKYRNEPTVVDGITFPSRLEADVYVHLNARELAGEIRELRRQAPFAIVINGIHVCDYVADFVFKEKRRTVVVDAKGVKTAIYRLKRKLMAAVHKVEVREALRKDYPHSVPSVAQAIEEVPFG